MAVEADKDYTPSELAQAVGVHRETVRRWLRTKRLPAKRNVLTGRYTIRGADVLKMIAELEAERS